jgi:hypothetical protein
LNRLKRGGIVIDEDVVPFNIAPSDLDLSEGSAEEIERRSLCAISTIMLHNGGMPHLIITHSMDSGQSYFGVSSDGMPWRDNFAREFRAKIDDISRPGTFFCLCEIAARETRRSTGLVIGTALVTIARSASPPNRALPCAHNIAESRPATSIKSGNKACDNGN